jgi:hypothetical protein
VAKHSLSPVTVSLDVNLLVPKLQTLHVAFRLNLVRLCVCVCMGGGGEVCCKSCGTNFVLVCMGPV